MASASITAIIPSSGSASGGELVRLALTGVDLSLELWFGEHRAEVIAVRREGDLVIVDARTPQSIPGACELIVVDRGTGARATLPAGYRFLRAQLATESELTRAVRQLLRELKRQVIANVSTSVAVDYDDNPEDETRVTAMATLPSVVLSGPTLRANRFYATNLPIEDLVIGSDGPELRRRSPATTVDLAFTITAASERTAELFNLMAAVAAFLGRNHWLELQRDPDNPALGTVRWELDPEGEFRTELEGRSDVRGFTCGFVLRGFDIDEGLPREFGRAVEQTELRVERGTP